MWRGIRLLFKSMLRVIFIICMTIIASQSCKVKDTNSQKIEHKGLQLDLEGSLIGSCPIVTNFENFSNLISGNIQVIDSCATSSVQFKQGKIYYDCLSYENWSGVRFRRVGNEVSLYDVDFRLSDLKLVTNKFTFSSQTNLSNLQELFPNEEVTLSETAAFPYNEEGMLGLFLDQAGDYGNRPSPPLIRVWFRNDSLMGLEYNWQPEYTENQWEKYLNEKSRIDKMFD